MKTLDLHRIWEILNFISDQENILNNKGIYPNFLGLKSSYYEMEFECFIDYYSFKIDEDEICIFNDDRIAYEDYHTDDYSYVPKELLDFNNEQLMNWIKEKTEIHLSRLEDNKKTEKENLKIEIERLTRKLNQL